MKLVRVKFDAKKDAFYQLPDGIWGEPNGKPHVTLKNGPFVFVEKFAC